MRRGSVYQRHNAHCPRAEHGGYARHKCRGLWAYYVLAGRAAGGRRRQVTRSGFPTKREAERALRDVLSRENAEIAEVHRLTTGAYLWDWFAGKRALRASTRRVYEIHIRLHLIPHPGHIRLADLRPHHLHATLRSALNTAVRRRLIPWNPAVHVELPSADRPTTAVWTPDQLGDFLEYHRDHRLSALFRLIALAGLRRGEALGLRWSDVDLDNAAMRVSQQLLSGPGGLTFGPPKTRSGVRAVALDVGTVQALRSSFAAATTCAHGLGGRVG